MKGLIGTGQRVGRGPPLGNFNAGNIGPFFRIFMELCANISHWREGLLF